MDIINHTPYTLYVNVQEIPVGGTTHMPRSFYIHRLQIGDVCFSSIDGIEGRDTVIIIKGNQYHCWKRLALPALSFKIPALPDIVRIHNNSAGPIHAYNTSGCTLDPGESAIMRGQPFLTIIEPPPSRRDCRITLLHTANNVWHRRIEIQGNNLFVLPTNWPLNSESAGPHM